MTYKQARGIIPWKEGVELPEDTIARLRGRPNWRCECGALSCDDMTVCRHCGEEREYGLTASEARAIARKLNEVDELRRQLAEPKVAQNAKDWEADHQRRALEHYGLAEEFPYGCDAIEEVAEALLGARQQIGHLKDIMEMGGLELKRIRGDNERMQRRATAAWLYVKDAIGAEGAGDRIRLGKSLLHVLTSLEKITREIAE